MTARQASKVQGRTICKGAEWGHRGVRRDRGGYRVLTAPLVRTEPGSGQGVNRQVVAAPPSLRSRRVGGPFPT